MQKRNAILALTLFGAFSLGSNISSLLHESGHALGCWLSGGRINWIMLRPFDYSRVDYDLSDRPAWTHLLTGGGGILFGVLFVLPLIPLTNRIRAGSIAWIIASMTLCMALLLNGTLLLQSAFTGAGDPGEVLAYGNEAYGLPRVVLRLLFAIVAITMLVWFAKRWTVLLLSLGPHPDDSRTLWTVTILLGIMSYFGLMTAHTWFFGDAESLRRQFFNFYVPYMLCLAAAVAGAALWAFRVSRSQPREQAPALAWSRAGILFLLASILIGLELAFTSHHITW